MKKIVSLLLLMAMLATLVACGGNTSGKETEREADIVAFKEQIVWDEEEYRVRILDLNPESLDGYKIRVAIENRSTEKTYKFRGMITSINKIPIAYYALSPDFTKSLSAGDKEVEHLDFRDGATLANFGVTHYTDIEVRFWVYDKENEIASKSVHIYPYGEGKANQIRENLSTEKIMINNERVEAIYTGCYVDGFYGYSAALFFLNKTDMNTTFVVDEIYINGLPIEYTGECFVYAGRAGYDNIPLEDAMTENGIKEIDSIQLRVRAYNKNEWLASETVTIRP